jgi:hypothetical protein
VSMIKNVITSLITKVAYKYCAIVLEVEEEKSKNGEQLI